MIDILLRVNSTITNDQLNTLFASAWELHTVSDFQPVLSHSLLYVCAYHEEQLVGFVNLAWDGGIHAFLLDTTVHRDFQKQGIGTKLVRHAVDAARQHGIEWIHVDYEPHLASFYEACGFRHTEAGVLNLKQP